MYKILLILIIIILGLILYYLLSNKTNVKHITEGFKSDNPYLTNEELLLSHKYVLTKLVSDDELS